MGPFSSRIFQPAMFDITEVPLGPSQSQVAIAWRKSFSLSDNILGSLPWSLFLVMPTTCHLRGISPAVPWRGITSATRKGTLMWSWNGDVACWRHSTPAPSSSSMRCLTQVAGHLTSIQVFPRKHVGKTRWFRVYPDLRFYLSDWRTFRGRNWQPPINGALPQQLGSAAAGCPITNHKFAWWTKSTCP